MFNGQTIRHLLDSKNITQVDLIKHTGISNTALFKIMKGESMPQVDTLEKIADFLNVPMDYFFDRNIKTTEQATTVNGNGNKVQNGNGNVMIENQAKEIEHLKQLLEEKEKSIQDKERTIQILLNQNK